MSENAIAGALTILRNNKHLLKDWQYRRLRCQVLSGDPNGALRDMRKLLLLQGTNAIKTGSKN